MAEPGGVELLAAVLSETMERRASISAELRERVSGLVSECDAAYRAAIERVARVPGQPAR